MTTTYSMMKNQYKFMYFYDDFQKESKEMTMDLLKKLNNFRL